MKNNDYICPICGTKDFKIENGYYVCQICGNQTQIEEKPKKEIAPKIKKELDKSADKLIPLIIYSFMALIAIIPVFQELVYFDGITLLFLKLIYSLTMICFVCITFCQMKGKIISPIIKNLLFYICVFFKVVTTIVEMVLLQRFIFVDLLYDAIYISLVWLTTYKFAKWIKK